MSTSKIRSFVNKVKDEVSLRLAHSPHLWANRREKSHSLAATVSRESLSSCVEPTQSSQHIEQRPEAYEDDPLDQRECALNVLAAIIVTQPHSSKFRKS